MKRWNEALERREAMRMHRRLPCEVWVSSHRYEGVLEEVSAHAVVVRMHTVPAGLHEAKLTFSTPNGPSFALQASPVRGHTVAHTLSRLLRPSVVLHLDAPTDAYLRWVDALPLGSP